MITFGKYSKAIAAAVGLAIVVCTALFGSHPPTWLLALEAAGTWLGVYGVSNGPPPVVPVAPPVAPPASPAQAPPGG